jgi:hypothetical protein
MRSLGAGDVCLSVAFLAQERLHETNAHRYSDRSARARTCDGPCNSNPSTPTTTLGAPTPVSPLSGASISGGAQPITLTVTNVSGASASATYTFEVTTDSGFANKVSTKTVAAGTSGQTSVQADTLPANATYYWHARVQDGSNTGAFSAASTFTLGAAISISAPTPVSPANGTTTGGWPILTVTNAVRTGPAGALVYKFEIANNSGFSPVAVSSTVVEGVGQTSFQASENQASTVGATYYWRVTAVDTSNNVSSAASAARTFVFSSLAQGMAALQGLTLWPTTQPPAGTYGHVKISQGWDLFTRVSPLDGRSITSPTLEIIRILDLLDRGMDPAAACAWLGSTYGTSGLYYPGIVEGVIGFSYHYMAKTNGEWELVFRVAA